MDVREALTRGDERDLWQVWNLLPERRVWQAAIERSRADGKQNQVAAAEQALAELPEVTALQALEANRRLVELLTGRRWFVMQQAREDGATWEQIGEALGMSRQAANEWYRKKIELQEQYAGQWHDAARARAALEDQPTNERNA